ncbi:hypothetical protein [Flavobacterium difficile]|uniref:Replication initiation factor n=1 Tax=Flavobacterium difficile TaxID=2709659 RepID=A0ABX0I4C8_9FLAO|nr:hypothetical protein [Flavobacterium difficile]NHM01684.1 hypothetical protein [Flavobacterium difficile]
MIDNVRFFAINKDEFEQNVRDSGIMDFKAPYCVNTGEVLDYPKKGKLWNLDVNITKCTAFLNGSLHKFYNYYFNNEEHNYNDFNYNDLLRVISEIKFYTGINPLQTKITNLEFGFNIEVDKDPQEIIDKCVMMFNHKSPSKNLKYGGRGDYKEFELTDYNIKIYNKSKQYGTSKYILRVEIKIRMKRILERLEIFNLNDLMDKSKLSKLFWFFIDKIEKLHIIDEFEHRKDIPKRDMDKLVKYTSSFHWAIILRKPQKVKNIHINEFEKLIRKYNLDELKDEILLQLLNKFHQLLEPELKHVET